MKTSSQTDATFIRQIHFPYNKIIFDGRIYWESDIDMSNAAIKEMIIQNKNIIELATENIRNLKNMKRKHNEC